MTPQTVARSRIVVAGAKTFLDKIGAGYDLFSLERLRRQDRKHASYCQAAKRLREALRQRRSRKILTARRSRSIAQHPDARGTPTKEGTTMKIERNDKVRITGLLGKSYFWAEGTVLSAVNRGGKELYQNWYLELDVTAAHGPPRGYFFWKQGLDGGSIEKITDDAPDIDYYRQILEEIEILARLAPDEACDQILRLAKTALHKGE